MRYIERICIFCKRCSADSRSVEHIIPESLGNRGMTLPPGVVCDKCNGYFSTHIEQAFLGAGNIQALRFECSIPNKKGRLPAGLTIELNNQWPGYLLPGHVFIDAEPKTLRSCLYDPRGAILTPAGGPPSDVVTSRFLAKVAIEAFASQMLQRGIGLMSLVVAHQFDPIRGHARRGNPADWCFYVRYLYDYNQGFLDFDGAMAQRVCEFDFFYIAVAPDGRFVRAESMDNVIDFIFVLGLWGCEFALSLVRPQVWVYEKWLEENSYQTPLSMGKNRGQYDPVYARSVGRSKGRL